MCPPAHRASFLLIPNERNRNLAAAHTGKPTGFALALHQAIHRPIALISSPAFPAQPGHPQDQDNHQGAQDPFGILGSNQKW